MIGNLYDTMYQLACSISLVGYEVWIFAKNGKAVTYGKPNELYTVIGSYFKLVNVNNYIIDEDMQYINLHTDL